MATSQKEAREEFRTIVSRLRGKHPEALGQLENLAGRVAAQRAPLEVAWLRLGLARLGHRTEFKELAPTLAPLDEVLRGALEELNRSRADEQRVATRLSVRARVLGLIEGHGRTRPSQLTELAETDIYQVSRAIRQLVDEGLIEPAPREPGQDGRTIYYQSVADRELRTAVTGAERTLHLDWEEHDNLDGAVTLSLTVDSVDLWAAADAPRATDPVEAVTSLVSAWPYLVLEDGLPSGRSPRPLKLMADEIELYGGAVHDMQGAPDRLLARYSEKHDLAQILRTPAAPQAWVTREGNICWVLSESDAFQLSFSDVRNDMESFANRLIEFTEVRGDHRSRQLRSIWDRRDSGEVTAHLSIATGLPTTVLATLEDETETSEFWEIESDRFEINELVAAARMASGAPTTAIREILRTIRSAPQRATPDLDEITEDATSFLGAELQDLRPFEQGYQLASWLRSRLDLPNAVVSIDPFEFLARWAVHVVEVDLISTTDGFACWGPRHGPMVCVNRNGIHNQAAGRRTTGAHEIAHLLADRRTALPFAEVMRGRAPAVSEKRANAFAAEFLLPRAQAVELFLQFEDPGNGVEHIAEISGVSLEVIAWQIRNAGIKLAFDSEAYLRSLVSQPEAF